MTMITTSREAEAFVKEVLAGTVKTFDFETKGLDPYAKDTYIIGLAGRVDGGNPCYLPFAHPETKNLPIEVLDDVWHAALKKGWMRNHNLPFDTHMAHEKHDLPYPPKQQDSMVAMQLENENRLGPGGAIKGAFALKPWCEQTFGPDAVMAETELRKRMLEKGLDPKADMWRVAGEEVAPYACGDVVLVDRAYGEFLDARLEKLGITALAEEYYDYRRLLTRMEGDGMHLEPDLVEEFRLECIMQKSEREQLLRDMAGNPDLNLNSPVQMMKLLKMGSTEKVRLERKARTNPGAAHLASFRRWDYARSHFYEPLQKFTHGDILHPQFRTVRTGRLSMFEPNLHSTPHHREEYRVKEVFTAPPGYFLVQADWDQAEMRLGAHYTQDPVLMGCFNTGGDPHALVQADLASTGITRQGAKTLNYGVAYGKGARAIAWDLEIAESKAREWLAAYHARYVGPKNLYQRMQHLADLKGWIRMWDGRYRRFDKTKNFARTASNSLLQGGVGGMARKAMLRLEDYVYNILEGFMWIQIHDSIILCLPLKHDRPQTYRRIRGEMEDFKFRVKMTVTIKKGPSWHRLEKVAA